MKYIQYQNQSENFIKFTMESVNRSEIFGLIEELSNFYLLQIFMDEISQNKLENPIEFSRIMLEDDRLKEFTKTIKNKLRAIKMMPEVSFSELLINLPIIEKVYLENYTAQERNDIDELFKKVIRNIILERMKT
ncbi:hypothetical protein CLV96_3892 [Leptospira meyeri]|uniref:Uncharacterized protein n=1 Tax=Leptospira meyeri TaxID=29508 RepID=A0A4V3HHP9_LEPME|nr:hypothetical protein [Leptospira meyeri]TDY66513.1 hypothetical protein CLV96_3892 [Leptospira meyeri]